MVDNVTCADVCEVYLKDLDPASGKQYFLGLTTKNEVASKVTQDFLRGGIGNGVVTLLQSQKELTFNVSTLLHTGSSLEIENGSTFQQSATLQVMTTEKIQCTVAGKVTLTGTPISGATPVVMTGKGKQIVGTFTTGSFTATTPADIAVGSYYTAMYPTSVTGEYISLDAKLFPKAYYVEMHSICYDPDSNKVFGDIYWQFNKAVPTGSLTKSYEPAKTNGDEMSFTCLMASNGTEYAKFVMIPRSGAVL